MIIYETTNIVNGKKYIGKDKNNNPKYLGSGHALLRALKKYGRKNFKKTIIEHCKNDQHLDDREIFWIDYFDAVNSNKYYNLSSGGDGGVVAATLTEEFRKKMSKVTSGENNGMFGRNHTKEALQLQREKAIGRYTLEWFIERFGEEEGERLWKERNKKLSEDRKGDGNPFFGKTWEYEKHPRYIDINSDELLSLIKQGLGGVLLAKHFNTTTTTIYKKIKHYWGCKIGELK
jgi:group I intron endonuclease